MTKNSIISTKQAAQVKMKRDMTGSTSRLLNDEASETKRRGREPQNKFVKSVSEPLDATGGGAGAAGDAAGGLERRKPARKTSETQRGSSPFRGGNLEKQT